MAKTQNGYELIIGIDVSKAKLDVATGSQGTTEVIDNDAKANEKLFHLRTIISRKTLVATEATGGYESLLVDTLHKSKISIAVVNPRRIRDFAKGVGWDAKTDAIDAKLIAYYGEVVTPQPCLSLFHQSQ